MNKKFENKKHVRSERRISKSKIIFISGIMIFLASFLYFGISLVKGINEENKALDKCFEAIEAHINKNNNNTKLQ